MSVTTDYDELFGFVSAALISVGGFMGYLKRGSVASLVAGGGSGALLAYGVNARDPRIVTGVAGVLFAAMGSRVVKGGRFMPAGLVTLLSSGLLWRFGSKLL
ncbi:hypothetical protein JCM16303_000472 [Sporobolomyces ruberrimus]